MEPFLETELCPACIDLNGSGDVGAANQLARSLNPRKMLSNERVNGAYTRADFATHSVRLALLASNMLSCDVEWFDRWR